MQLAAREGGLPPSLQLALPGSPCVGAGDEAGADVLPQT